MKKTLLFLSLSILLVSCGNKKVKNETLPEIKVEVVEPQIEENIVEEKPTLIFTVQIGSFKKESIVFSKLENVQISKENNLYKYRLGSFETYQEARSFRKTLLNKYPGVFVQALKNNNPIPIQEAIK